MEASIRKGKSNYLLLIGTVFLRFFGDSLFYAFLARYLKTLPFLSWQLSVLTMAIPIMGMLGSAFLAFFGTTTRRRRHIYLGLFSLECLVVAFFGFRDEFWYVLLFDMIANFCTGPSFSIIDTFIVGATDRAKKTYASARRFGALGYIVGVIGGGYLISFLSDKWTFFIGGCLMLSASILFLVLRFDQKDEEMARTPQEKPSFFRNFGSLMHIKNYLLFLFAFSLAEGMYLATDTAFSLFTVDLGIEDHIYGYAFGAAIVVEFIIMLFFRKSFGQRKMKWALLLGAICQILRPALFAIPFDYPYVYLF
ncbi:MAG: MFS transporter, partial [Bacilli bacterium]|nr:MFS transporter [Bacilli bacterium]